MENPLILHIAVFKPMRRCFDYLPVEGSSPLDLTHLQLGIRVLVPFGRQQLVGIVVSIDHHSDLPTAKLRAVSAVLDAQPLITPPLFLLYQWASRYYQHPLGEVMLGSFPTLLRRVPRHAAKQQRYQLTAEGQTIVCAVVLKRSPKQQALWQLLYEHPQGLTVEAITTKGIGAVIVRALLAKGYITPLPQLLQAPVVKPLRTLARKIDSPLLLNSWQKNAVDQLTARHTFHTFVLQGVTGSGKTEVYLQAIANCLQRGKQALVLVPEIGLTPQTIARFEQRFSQPIVVLHSGLSELARKHAWLHAQNGQARIIIGTRSAIFVPLPQLGMIILDEEHDASFKQQSGFRYSARDLAIMRGRLENVPVVLGTATPSLEALRNVEQKRFTLLRLPERAGNAVVPTFNFIDLRKKSIDYGLSPELLAAMKDHLAQDNQVLLFLNRRGRSLLISLENA